MSSNPSYLGEKINKCKTCSIEIPSIQKFCSRSCSATHTNKNRKVSEETKRKIAKTLTKQYKCKICECSISKHRKFCENCTPRKKKKEQEQYEIEGPFTQLRICNCKICHAKFLSRTSLQYCVEHRNDASNKRKFYAFRFNVYHYPELFDINQLEKLGWYSPKGKSGKWNPDGMSRDHKVSIADAIKFGHDRFYITHPMNCDLIPHKINNMKKSKSSITYEELKFLVDTFESVRT